MAELDYEGENKTPFLVFEKAIKLDIDSATFWFKLGMLLFDSRYYPESFTAFEKALTLESVERRKFAALTWMGHLKDLMGERQEALEYYNQALEHDTGEVIRHDQFGIRIERVWVERRLKRPFTWKK